MKIKLELEKNCIHYGCTFNLICETLSNHSTQKFDFFWSKNDGELPENSFFHLNSLMIKNFTEINLGIYTCSVLKDKRVQSNSSIMFFDKNGSIKHTIENIEKMSLNEEELDERLRYLFGSKELTLGSNFAIECLDLCTF